jgi:hypothetical protein
MADYSITAVARRVVYTGSAGVGPYNFNFPVLAETDLAVYVNDSLQTLTTDYTVSIGVTGTGSITLVSAATGSDNVTIVGARDIERTTDFVTAGDLLASSLNTELDSQTIFVQQVSEDASRAIKAPVTDPTSIDMTLPTKASRAGKFLLFSATGDVGVASTDTLTVSTLQAFTDYQVDTFTGDNTTVAFTLSAEPGQKGNTQVYFDGVYQLKVNYSLVGTALTFTTAPASGVKIEVVHGQAAATYTPDDGSITFGKLATAAVDTDLTSVSGSHDTLPTALATKTYVDAQIGSNNELSEVLANGNTSGGTNIVVSAGDSITTDTIAETTAAAGVTIDGVLLKDGEVDGRDVSVDGTKLDTVETNADVTDTANVTAAGALMDSELTNITAVKALNQGVATTDSPSFAGLTATTADVNGGTIDGTVIGGSSAGAGTFTTLSATGNTTLGDAAGDVTQNKGGFAAQGTGLPGSGSGVEINFGLVAGEGTVQAFDRDLSAWEQLRLRGNQVAFDISGSEKVRMDSSGQVLIGSSTVAGDGALHVSGSNAEDVQITMASVGNTNNQWGIGRDGNVDGRFVIADTSDNWSTSTERLSISTTTGNVGIGVTPTYKLDIGGVTESIFRNTGGSVQSAVYSSGGGSQGQFGTFSAHPTVLITGGSEKVRITSAGNVGIGESGPSARLHVKGAGTAPQLIVEETGANSSFMRIISDSGNAGLQFQRGGLSGTDTWTIYDSSGILYVDDNSGSVLNVTPTALNIANAAGPALLNEAATATNPTLAPNKADLDTGIGWVSANVGAAIAGGAEAFRWDSSGNVTTTGDMFIDRDGGTVSAWLNIDATNGYQTGVRLLTAGVKRWEIGTHEASALEDFVLRSYNDAGGGVIETMYITRSTSQVAFAGNVVGTNAAGPALLNEAASSTNPTLAPNKADLDTGIGWSSANELSVIAAGSETIRVGSSTTQFFGPVRLRSYTVAGLPASSAGDMAYCSDETGGAVPVFSDGTNWRRVTDRAIAS